MRIVIFGANGPTGRLLVSQALGAGHQVIAVTRRPDEFPQQHSNLTVAGADVLDASAVDGVVSGADAILSTLGAPYGRKPVTVYSVGARNILAAMERHHLRRLVVVSSSATDLQPYADAGFFFNRVVQPFVVNILGKTVYEDMRRMEELIRNSEVDWTIVRPSGLFDTNCVSDYELAEDHIAGRFTARSDLAAAMLAQVEDERYIRKILAVATSENVPSMARLIVREAFSASPPWSQGRCRRCPSGTVRRSSIRPPRAYGPEVEQRLETSPN
jgi:putative NADH-flavin reductase